MINNTFVLTYRDRAGDDHRIETDESTAHTLKLQAKRDGATRLMLYRQDREVDGQLPLYAENVNNGRRQRRVKTPAAALVAQYLSWAHEQGLESVHVFDRQKTSKQVHGRTYGLKLVELSEEQARDYA